MLDNSLEMESFLLTIIMRMIIILILLFIITLCINILFGHRSFWRSSLSPSPSSTNIIKRKISDSKFKTVDIDIKVDKNTLPLNELNENLIREILFYISPNDLLNMNTVNRMFKQIIDDDN